MGYTTEFKGKITIDPPLSEGERDFLMKFSDTRRMNRTKGPYFVDGTGDFGQGRDPDVIDFNTPPDGQPGLWCKWEPTEDGSAIKWNGMEKFYAATEWMDYLMKHFLNKDRICDLPFLQGHTCNGSILAQGEEMSDRWKLVVENNVVRRVGLE
jgi:hypothetical protein